MNKSRTKTVTISADIMAELESVPSISKQGRVINFTPEQDALLVYLFENKAKLKSISWWRDKYGWGSRDCLEKRYNELTK